MVFLQGCPLRCAYCHNPDTWEFGVGQEIDADTLISRIHRYETFLRHSGGGITVSGGEPMSQHGFVAEFFEKAGEYGLHRALDTSGTLNRDAAIAVLRHTDLLLLDVKSCDAEKYASLTGVSQTRFTIMLEEAAKRHIPVWLRHVVVPGLTDQAEELAGLQRLQERYPNIEKVELLPFHKMGEYKWAELGLPYTLSNTPEASKEEVNAMQQLLDTKTQVSSSGC